MADEPTNPEIEETEINKIIDARKKLMEEVLKIQSNTSFAVQNLIASYNEATAAVENLQLQQEAAKDNIKETLTIQEEIVGAKLREIDAAIAVLRTAEKQSKESEAEIKRLGEQSKKLRLRLRFYTQIEGETESIAGHLGIAYRYETSSLKALIESTKKIEGVASGWNRIATQIKGMTTWQEVGYGFAVKWFKTTVKFNMELYKANLALNKATGMAERFSGNIEDTWKSFSLLGMSASDAAGNLGTLTDTFAQFTNEGKPARDDILALSAEMNGLGVSTADYASSLNFLTKTMGITTPEAREFTKELAAYGQSIGATPKKFVQDFAKSTPKLAAYGGRMIGIFKKLQKQSKATGVSFDTLLTITEQFQEFDNITGMVARLNAQFSKINLDPMQLMFLAEEDPALARDEVRKAIRETGVELEHMDSANQRMLAQTLGFGTDVAAMIADQNNDYDSRNELNIEWNDLLVKSSGIMEKMDTILKSLALTGWVKDAVDWFDNILTGITETEEKMQKWAVIALVVFPLVTGWIAKASLAMVGSAIASGMLAKAKTVETVAELASATATKAGAVAKTQAAVAVGSYAAAMGMSTVATQASIPPTLALNSAWYANPIVWMVAGVIALSLALYGMIKYWDEWTGWLKESGVWLDAIVISLGFLFPGFRWMIALPILLIKYWDEFLGIIDWVILKMGQLGNLDFAGFFGGEVKVSGGGKAAVAHRGMTNSPGGLTKMKSDEVMSNVSSGTSVLTKGNSQTIETLLRDLTAAVNKLSSGGGTGDNRPHQINLVVDGKTLATTVYNNSKYVTAV